jgi:hypothetical protein
MQESIPSAVAALISVVIIGGILFLSIVLLALLN